MSYLDESYNPTISFANKAIKGIEITFDTNQNQLHDKYVWQLIHLII